MLKFKSSEIPKWDDLGWVGMCDPWFQVSRHQLQANPTTPCTRRFKLNAKLNPVSIGQEAVIAQRCILGTVGTCVARIIRADGQPHYGDVGFSMLVVKCADLTGVPV
jgi:hypothetical protein